MKLKGYKLIDFGDGEKLELFGNKTIVRPSSQAVGSRRYPDKWDEASARYDDKAGWRFYGKPFEKWTLTEDALTLALRLQQNGQVGLFAEHSIYLDGIQREVERISATNVTPRLLNLFAYTGMCSIVAAKSGAEVCHVDSSKASLDWASENFKLNDLNNIRLIREDAVLFLRKEAKRENRYNVIVLDPPGFSRFKEGSWNLPDIMVELVDLLSHVITPKGVIFFTLHGSEINGDMVRNLILDKTRVAPENVTTEPLGLTEVESGRRLPASTLVVCRT